jgi:hypothetical protein
MPWRTCDGNVGISSDAAVVPDAQLLINGLAEAYDSLREALVERDEGRAP